MDNPRILRRYTDLTSVIDLLVKRHMVLLDPDTWDDKNDSYFMSSYKNRKKLKSLKAICFTTAAETYHHWKIFSPGNSGICISFITEKIHRKLGSTENLKSGLVEYRTLKELREGNIPPLEKLPFIKRYPFRDEKEFRIIYESTTETHSSYPIAIDISDIDRVVLSPWVHPALVESTRLLIKKIPGCENLKINKSTLIGNEHWKKFAHSQLVVQEILT